MTTRRVLIGAGGGSPLRVSAAGVDVSGASFESLIFDANQPPLRVYLNGWMVVPYIHAGDGSLAHWAIGPALPATPPGTHPMFMTMWYQPDGGALTPTQGNTPYGTTPCYRSGGANGWGAGASVGGGVLTGISFVKAIVLPSGQVQVYPDNTHVGYCILRNYQ
ncbi:MULTISPECIES: hypothetical protein [unclassified Bradyrhizobium]|uniref:hypothetical protein n=1 Tax=unclassified Bradyrhizobium TaxID=2631580 RepID=UPI002916587E|nr:MULTISPECIES: hypothetical protein [unclassified Bradyrhizobium]